MKLSETQMMAIQAAEQIVVGLFQQAGKAVEQRDRIYRETEQAFGLAEGALQSTHGLDMQQGLVIERPKPAADAQEDWSAYARSDPAPSSVTEASGDVTGIEIQKDGGYKISKDARWTAPNGAIFMGPATLSAEEVAAAMIRAGGEAAA